MHKIFCFLCGSHVTRTQNLFSWIFLSDVRIKFRLISINSISLSARLCDITGFYSIVFVIESSCFLRLLLLFPCKYKQDPLWICTKSMKFRRIIFYEPKARPKVVCTNSHESSINQCYLQLNKLIIACILQPIRYDVAECDAVACKCESNVKQKWLKHIIDGVFCTP